MMFIKCLLQKKSAEAELTKNKEISAGPATFPIFCTVEEIFAHFLLVEKGLIESKERIVSENLKIYSVQQLSDPEILPLNFSMRPSGSLSDGTTAPDSGLLPNLTVWLCPPRSLCPLLNSFSETFTDDCLCSSSSFGCFSRMAIPLLVCPSSLYEVTLATSYT